MLVAVDFSILADNPSGPLALVVSRDARRSKTSSSVQRSSSEHSKSCKSRVAIGGCEVLKHEWKKEFKRLAFSWFVWICAHTSGLSCYGFKLSFRVAATRV